MDDDFDDDMSDMEEVEEAPDEKEYFNPKNEKAVVMPNSSAMARTWKPAEA